MSETPIRWPVLLVGGMVLVAAGALGGMWWAGTPGRATTAPSAQPPSTSASPAPGAPSNAAPMPEHDHAQMAMPDGTSAASGASIELPSDVVARIGITTTPATAGTSTVRLRLPGVVEPNSYKQVTVTPLVSGRITQVRAELGQSVMLNEVLATVLSPELAEAQTEFIAAKAEHAAHDQRQARAQRLFAIGAVSRQELEMLDAEKSREDQRVETARTRLTLLGIPEDKTQRLATPADVVTTFDVRAPMAGVVTARQANQGLNVDPTTPLFTVVDLSTVWVVADVYETDFARIRVGTSAAITAAAYPGMTLSGRVAYIDPQVRPDTRTAKIRIEVPNTGGRLKLGMFVDVQVGERMATSVVRIPASAVQPSGAESVVYVAQPGATGRFEERPVRLGEPMDGQIAVVSGLQAGEQVVTTGAFFLHAERQRAAR